MAKEKFEEDCESCRPVAFDPFTMQLLPPLHPMTLALARVWATFTRADKEAFHRCTCLNSRAPHDLAVIARMQQMIEKAATPH